MNGCTYCGGRGYTPRAEVGVIIVDPCPRCAAPEPETSDIPTPTAHHRVHVGRHGDWTDWSLECLPSCPKESYDEAGDPVPGEGCWVQSHWGEDREDLLVGVWPSDCWPAMAVATWLGDRCELTYCGAP